MSLFYFMEIRTFQYHPCNKQRGSPLDHPWPLTQFTARMTWGPRALFMSLIQVIVHLIGILCPLVCINLTHSDGPPAPRIVWDKIQYTYLQPWDAWNQQFLSQLLLVICSSSVSNMLLQWSVVSLNGMSIYCFTCSDIFWSVICLTASEQPCPNEIQFQPGGSGTTHDGTMTWRYPEPRVLTRITMTPIPLRTATNVTDDDDLSDVSRRDDYWK